MKGFCSYNNIFPLLKDVWSIVVDSWSRWGLELSGAHAGIGETLHVEKYVHLWCQESFPAIEQVLESSQDNVPLPYFLKRW